MPIQQAHLRCFNFNKYRSTPGGLLLSAAKTGGGLSQEKLESFLKKYPWRKNDLWVRKRELPERMYVMELCPNNNAHRYWKEKENRYKVNNNPQLVPVDESKAWMTVGYGALKTRDLIVRKNAAVTNSSDGNDDDSSHFAPIENDAKPTLASTTNESETSPLAKKKVAKKTVKSKNKTAKSKGKPVKSKSTSSKKKSKTRNSPAVQYDAMGYPPGPYDEMGQPLPPLPPTPDFPTFRVPEFGALPGQDPADAAKAAAEAFAGMDIPLAAV